MFLITEKPIDCAAYLDRAALEQDGAVASFLGVVRNHSDGRRVRALEYEAYPPMALKTFQQIANEAKAQWGISRLLIVHRIGRLEIGETAVLVIATAPHRPEAFAACSHAIRRIKEISPIWKKEWAEQGPPHWVDHDACAKIF